MDYVQDTLYSTDYMQDSGIQWIMPNGEVHFSELFFSVAIIFYMPNMVLYLYYTAIFLIDKVL